MNPTMIIHLRTLLAHPDHPDRSALVAVLDDWKTATILSCLAPPGSLLQIAAAMAVRWSWDCNGWERHTDELVGLITDPHCSVHKYMLMAWSFIPSAVGVMRDQTDTLIAWAEQRIDPGGYADLAILLGPSDASARLLLQSPSSDAIGKTLRRWSMGIDPSDPTAWQAMIDPDVRAALHSKATPSTAFPAWGRDDAVVSKTILIQIVNDLFDSWSPDHLSIRGRIRWLERHVVPNLDVGFLALVASIGGSDALAEAVCEHLDHDPSSIPKIAEVVPWNRLHPRIQTVIDTTMQRSSDDRWKRTWACALGRFPIMPAPPIDASLLLWRIAPERWNDLDPSIRAALVPRRSYLPHHFYGWGVHPDLLVGKYRPYGWVFRVWNPDVPPDDLRAWEYADLLRAQSTLQDARVLIDLLDILPPNRHARFEQFINERLERRPEATIQPPWEWEGWGTLSADDRQRRLHDRLAVLWGDRDTLPAVRGWRARNDGLATLALMAGDVLGLDDPTPILAALLAQVPALRGDETTPTPPLPPPTTMEDARRAQIERLPLAPNDRAYAAWCLRVLDQDMVSGSTLIALHPDVAIALAPLLNADQQKAIAASPAAQGWGSMTFLSWAAACAPAHEQPMPPRQKRIR